MAVRRASLNPNHGAAFLGFVFGTPTLATSKIHETDILPQKTTNLNWFILKTRKRNRKTGKHTSLLVSCRPPKTQTNPTCRREKKTRSASELPFCFVGQVGFAVFFCFFSAGEDGKLSAKEVKAYCKAKLSTELPQERRHEDFGDSRR